MVSLDRVTLLLAGERFLKQTSLGISRGEIFVLTGTNRNGLTSFLKLLTGILVPAEGSVRVMNTDMHRTPAARLAKIRSRIGVVMKNGDLVHNMSLFDNVALPLRYHTDLGEESTGLAVREKLSWVGLEKCESYLPAQMNEDQRKRGALARALVMDPELILYDEPETNPGQESSLSILGLLRRLKEKNGTTSVVVSGNASLALHFSDRRAVLQSEKILTVSQ